MTLRYDRSRLHAVLALKRLTFEGLARRLDISPIHLRHVVAGSRVPSQRLAAGLATELGRAAAFVNGDTNVLDASLIETEG